ncbi:MAG: glycosyltransferase family 2 protein, partial [Bacillota bacterium]
MAYAGVAGLCAFKDGKIVGTPFPRDNLDTNNVELRSRYRVKGDKFEVYRVDILREFPFPENLGGFVTEGLVWNRIARKYQIRCVNVIWAVVEYHPNGLSANSILLRAKHPVAASLYYEELLAWAGHGITLAHRLRAAANFDRFSMHRGNFWPFLQG